MNKNFSVSVLALFSFSSALSSSLPLLSGEWPFSCAQDSEFSVKKWTESCLYNAQYGSLEAVKTALKLGADVNSPQFSSVVKQGETERIVSNQTMLLYLLFNKKTRPDVFRFLIFTAHADLDAVDNDGNTFYSLLKGIRDPHLTQLVEEIKNAIEILTPPSSDNSDLEISNIENHNFKPCFLR
jgi:hypothetical protein